jgi:hypothetical protein
MARRVRTGALAVIAAAAAAGCSGDADPRAPSAPTLKATSHGTDVDGTFGSGCVDGTCFTGAYPLELHGRLPVAGRKRIVLTTDRPAARLSVAPMRTARTPPEEIGPHTPAEPSDEGGTRWTYRLPRGVKRVRAIDIRVRYTEDVGSGNFRVGVFYCPKRR